MKLDDTVVDILGDECPDGYEPYWESITIDMLMRHMIGFHGGPDLTRYAAEYNLQ